MAVNLLLQLRLILEPGLHNPIARARSVGVRLARV